MSMLRISAATCAVLVAVLSVNADPTIEIINVPPYGSLGYLYGKVTGVDHPEHYEVATYIQPEGVGWWTKPYWDPNTVPVDPNGSFWVNVTTGGAGSSDPRATLYSVNLLDAGENPPRAEALSYLPESLLFQATDTHERYGRTIPFSGLTWGVKESPHPVGPGPNRFSYDANDVWVDPDGKLHLTIRNRGPDWYSTEVILTESFGYGRYLFQTSSRVDQLDSNAVFGAFTWDAYGDSDLPPGRRNREIDFEDSRWSNPIEPYNSQFVIQPWDTPGNRYRFPLPDLGGDANLTRILTWEEGRLHFLLLRGHHSFGDYSPSDIIEEWTYLDDPDLQHFVPDPNRERFRFNFWLDNGTPPAGDGVLEVVIDLFDFMIFGDVNADGNVDTLDITPFVSALLAADGDAFGTAYPDWEYWASDVNEDGNVDTLDITPFVNLLVGGHAVPEPSCALLSIAGAWVLKRRKDRGEA